MNVGVLEGRPVGPGQFAGAGGVCAGRLGGVAQADVQGVDACVEVVYSVRACVRFDPALLKMLAGNWSYS